MLDHGLLALITPRSSVQIRLVVRGNSWFRHQTKSPAATTEAAGRLRSRPRQLQRPSRDNSEPSRAYPVWIRTDALNASCFSRVDFLRATQRATGEDLWRKRGRDSNARSIPSILEGAPWPATTGDRLVWSTGAGAANPLAIRKLAMLTAHTLRGRLRSSGVLDYSPDRTASS